MTRPYVAVLFLCSFLIACASKNPDQSMTDATEVVSPDITPAEGVASSATESQPPTSEFSPYAQIVGWHEAALASVNPIATNAGVDAIHTGGNAVDAAVAMALTLGVVDSHNSGIGGGCFILARLASGRVIAIDGREMAPAAATADMYIVDGEVQSDLSKTGALAAGIPGCLAALDELQKTAGKLSLKEVILPAAEIAEQGFEIDQTMASRLARTAERIARFPETAKVFLDDSDQPLQQGAKLVQKDLAESYRKIAEQGTRWFYKGEFALETEKWMQANGGIITAQDFIRYKTVLRQPISTQFKGYTVYGFPPPSSGGIHVAQMLNMLNEFDLSALSPAKQRHLQIEIMRLAFADRAHWLGDSDFVDVPKGLISEAYAKTLASKIDMEKASVVESYSVPPNADTELFDKHTTHIAAADKSGNWVAITTTLNTSFGSKVMIPGTGVLLNNQMDDFSIKPGEPNAFKLVGAEANSIAPGKRPLSSMSPTIVSRDGKPVITIGAAGGPTIITQVFQALVNHIELGKPLPEAVSTARAHQQWKPSATFVEPALSEEIRNELIKMGHELKPLGSFGGTQAIGLENGFFTALTEPRVIKRNEAEAESTTQ